MKRELDVDDVPEQEKKAAWGQKKGERDDQP